MKRFLLPLFSISAIASFAYTETPKNFQDASINAISPNGVYAVSESRFANFILRNLQTGEIIFELENGENTILGTGFGVGNCISNNGIAVISCDGFTPQYFEKGEIYDLEVPAKAVNNSASMGITPDGSRICGYLGIIAAAENDDALNYIPCIWNRVGDEYSEPVILPYPARDFANRIPQYALTNYISSDGKTVIGTIQDGMGLMAYPIIYREDENGEWSYEICHKELYDIGMEEFPEYPGEGPMFPSFDAYMTEAELDAYYYDVDMYYDGKLADEPNVVDYMTETEKALYLADKTAFDTWNAKYMAWAEAYNQLRDKAPVFQLNDVHMSENGKFFATSVQKIIPNPDPFSWSPRITVYYPWLFNLETGDISKYEDFGSSLATYVTNDGVVLANTFSAYDQPMDAYLIKEGKQIMFTDWIAEQNPVYGEWMKENMTFNIELNYIDPTTGDLIEEHVDRLMTGVPTATPDLSVVEVTIQNIWDHETDCESFVFQMSEPVDAVESVAMPVIDGDIIYDLFGRRISNASAPGIYIINGKKIMK